MVENAILKKFYYTVVK